MTFTAVSAGQLVKASVTNANLRHVGRLAGDMTPMDNSGVGETDTYDLGTPTYQWKDVNISGKFYQNGVEFKGGGGGGGGLLNAENKSHLEKQGINYPLSDPGICNESYTDSTNLVITPRVSYTSPGVTLVADINATSIDAMTTVWTADAGSSAAPTIATEATITLDGTSIKMSRTSLPTGYMGMYKTFTAFSLVDRQIAFSLYLDTLTNVTRAFIKLESTAGHDKTWYIPVASLTAATWAHITVNPNIDTADASTGTFNPASITKITLGVTVSNSQTVASYFDIMNSVDDFTIVDSGRKYMSFIWDDANQEPIYINAVAGTGIHQRNTYTITALENNYAVGATYAKQRNVTISGNQGVIPSGLSGAVAKTTWDLQEYWLPKSVSNQDVPISWRFWDEEFKVSALPSSTETHIYSATASTQKGYFKNGDKVIMYQKQKSGLRNQSRYNSTITRNAKILLLSADGGESSTNVTLAHATTPNTGADTSYWYVVRYSVKAWAKLEAMNANGALAEITPIAISGNPGLSLKLTDLFNRGNEAPASTNGWAGFHVASGGITNYADIFNNTLYIGTYSTTDHISTDYIHRDKELYGSGSWPIDVRFDFTPGHSTNAGYATANKFRIVCGAGSGGADNGAGVYFDGYNGAIHARNNGANVSSFAFTQTPGTVYSMRFQIYKDKIKIKAWAVAASEPASWNLEVVVTTVAAGNFFQFYGASGGQAGTYYMNIDNLTIQKLGSGYSVYGVLADGTGDKFVKALQYSRQDTTNQNPVGYQCDGYVPGTTE